MELFTETFGLAPVSAGVIKGPFSNVDVSELTEASVEASCGIPVADCVLTSELEATCAEDVVEVTESSGGAAAAAAAVPELVAALPEGEGGAAVLTRATTELYCCISMTAASSRTWMFLRQRILASTLCRSLPSISASSASDIPLKSGGG